jgi:site-specific DNA-methyltransferase (adenine-specific)
LSIAACLSTGKDDWCTPDELFKRYDDEYNFLLDAAADESNTKCMLWFGRNGMAEDALTADWETTLEMGHIWLNPPYSRGLQAKFVERAVAAVIATRRQNHIVCLLPARTDTALFHDYIKPFGAIEFLRGRVKFKGAKAGAPFPSMIVVF